MDSMMEARVYTDRLNAFCTAETMEKLRADGWTPVLDALPPMKEDATYGPVISEFCDVLQSDGTVLIDYIYYGWWVDSCAENPDNPFPVAWKLMERLQSPVGMDRDQRAAWNREMNTRLYEQKVDHAERVIKEWAVICRENSKTPVVSVGGLDSITLLLFVRKILGDHIDGVSISALEDPSIQKVHRDLGVIRVAPKMNEEETQVDMNGFLAARDSVFHWLGVWLSMNLVTAGLIAARSFWKRRRARQIVRDVRRACAAVEKCRKCQTAQSDRFRPAAWKDSVTTRHPYDQDRGRKERSSNGFRI